MNASDLSLRDLEYLVAVATHLHFGKAATQCHVSQPALSAQIKKLEHVLGIAVFERSNRRVKVTPIGEAVVKQAQTVLEETKRIFELCQQNESPFTTSFKVGSIATLGPYLIPHLLLPLRRVFKKGRYIFSEGLTHDLLKLLAEGELDVVLAAATFSEPAFQTIPLFCEPFLLTTPKRHNLAEKKPLFTKDLKVDEMVLLQDGHCLTDQTLSLCARRGAAKEAEFHATSLETLRHLVASELGYTLFPLLAARSGPKLNRLICYTKFEGAVGRDVVLAYRKRSSRGKEILAFANFIRENLPPGVTKLRGA